MSPAAGDPLGTAASPERSERIRTLFHDAVALAPDERADYLDQLPGQDSEVRREVESLLDAHARVDEVLDRLDRQLPWRLSSLAEEQDDPLLGRCISHYQILEKLGGGGMGVVYRARDTRLDRQVALKFLPPHLSLDEEAKRRLVREAKAASALDHPHICTVYEIGETEQGQLFLALAYYPGETLKKKIERGLLPIPEALGYAVQIAEGLAAAHEAGIVHRDIKPANVLVTTKGVAKLVDFGIARVQGEELTRTGVMLGTAAYMSPEQARGEAVDHCTDLWSLGVVLYEMLTRVRPFRGEHEQAVVYAIRQDAPEPIERLRPEVPAGLRRVIARCLEKDPESRYQRAEELLSDLRAAEDGEFIPERAGRRRPRPRRWALVYGGVAALLVALVAVIALLFRNGGRSGVIDSIAVLPVANLSGDPAQDALADGITDLLINHLSQVSGLDRVISRTSVMGYRGVQKPLSEIGRELGVDALIEASVLREGGRVRVNVGLVEAATERALWSSSFDRPIQDVLALQRDVARAVARQVAVQLTPQEAGRLRQAAPEVNPEAFELYLEGVRWDREANPRERVAYLERAVARDTGFALAYATMADDYAVQLSDYARAEEAIGRALALDPHLPRAHVTLGNIRQWGHGDWAGAEDALRRATELAPLDPRAHHELAMLLMRVGRFEEAVAEERRTLYLDPTNAEFQAGLGEIYVASRRYDEAVRELEKAFHMDPDRLLTTHNLGNAHFFMGRYDEAVRWYEQRLGIPPWVYAALGRHAEARAALSLLLSHVERGELRGGHSPAGELALIYTSLGEHEQALDWLERAVDERLGWVPVYLKVEAHLDPLRSDPRFKALLKKAGFD